MSDSPTDRVTFLFTDVEGSTRLWTQEPAAMSRALEAHDRALKRVIESHAGRVFSKSGDAFAAAFAFPADAVRAAIEGQRAIGAEEFGNIGSLRVRMALHAGTADERDGDYFGPPLNRCARLLELTNGGQVVCSGAVATLLAGNLPAGVELLDLGEHRLRDFADAERIFHIAHPDLTAAASLRVRTAPAATVPLTSFVGRRSELARVRRLVGESPMVTFTGLGGVGKTRLALEVVEGLADDFVDGVWHVDLSPVSDEAMVPDAVAKALGVLERPPEPITDTLVEYLAPREALLVLDNCEHVVDAVTKLVSLARHGAPGLKVVATSREPLGASGETIWVVAPLDLPGEATPRGTSDAEILFLDRARLVRPDLDPDPGTMLAIARICRLLDGIPLAIELAAALVRVLSPDQIAERLDDRFRLLTGGSRLDATHHQTLLATMDWSHDLLAPPERALLRRLAVFRGGFTLDAATAVCAFDEIGPELMIPLLGRLVETSLVDPIAVPGSRYRLLETVREYGERKLAESDEAEDLRRRHAEYFIVAGPGGPDGVPEPGTRLEWFSFRNTEYDNYRAALGWALGADEVEIATGLAIQLGNYWLNSGCCVGEGDRWLHTLAGRIEPSPSPDLQRVLTFAAMQAATLGRRREAKDLAVEVRTIADELGDAAGVASALTIQASAAQVEGHLAEAARLAEEAYEISAGLGDPRTPDKLLHLAEVHLLLGRHAEAEACLDAHLEIIERAEAESGYLQGMWRGVLAYYRGDLDEAEHRLRDVLGSIPDVIRAGIMFVRLHLARVSLARGNPRRAAAAAGVVIGLAQQLADAIAQGDALVLQADALLEAGDLHAAAGALEGGTQILRRVQSPLLGAALARVQGMARRRRDPEAAVEWLGASEALITEMGAVRSRPEQERFRRLLDLIEADLGGPAFSRLWDRASRMDPAAALALCGSSPSA